jgi:hypothetical protein
MRQLTLGFVLLTLVMTLQAATPTIDDALSVAKKASAAFNKGDLKTACTYHKQYVEIIILNKSVLAAGYNQVISGAVENAQTACILAGTPYTFKQ